MTWTQEEIRILIVNYSNLPWQELLKLLPGKSRSAITREALKRGLNRSRFSTRKGFYFVYGLCPRHGKILRTDIKWKGKRPTCPRPYCNRQLRTFPRHSKLREKYRSEESPA